MKNLMKKVIIAISGKKPERRSVDSFAPGECLFYFC